MKNKGIYLEKTARSLTYGLFLLLLYVVFLALFSREQQGEAHIGSFKTELLDGWILEQQSELRPVTLPCRVDTQIGEMLVLKNTLPKDLPDACSLMTRASMEDVYIYIDGELRESYASEYIPDMSFHIPSAYVVAELTKEDAGAEIEIHVRTKIQGKLNKVRIGPGNNVWFPVLAESLPVNAVSFIVVVLGMILIIVSAAMIRIMESARGTFFLGLLMVDIGIWVFSESDMRQFLFSRPSLSQYFSYFAVELIGALACMYFDEVQHGEHHKCYVWMETIISTQMVINILLHITGIASLYNTLIISHIWMGIAVIISFATIILDIRTKQVIQYGATALGLIGFLLMSVLEIAGFYLSRFHVFGIFACSGLVVLAVATVVQALLDQKRIAQIRHEKQTEMIFNTVEIIAGSIDARDEYTGGHSERVGRYASILAQGMAEKYELSQEDIVRIHYIGLLHDIGKIAIPDVVLNKADKLEKSEAELMKQHVLMGAEIMEGLSESMPDLADGILYHHERMDGTGYPKGLQGRDIPLVARILHLADCYDAMTSNRVYRKRLTDEEVRSELLHGAGSQFDPDLTEIFVQLLDNGDMQPYTLNGMATLETGEALKSALVDSYLQELDIKEKSTIMHPEYVRMLSFIMKMKEKKGERIDVLFLQIEQQEQSEERNTEDWILLEKYLRKLMNMQDICIEYSGYVKLVALFGWTDEHLRAFKKHVDAYGKIRISHQI